MPADSWRDILGSRGSHQGVFRAPIAWRGDPAGPGTSLDVPKARSRRVGGHHTEERPAACPRQSRGMARVPPRRLQQSKVTKWSREVEAVSTVRSKALLPGAGWSASCSGRGSSAASWARRGLRDTAEPGVTVSGLSVCRPRAPQAPGSPGRMGGQQTRQWGRARSQPCTDTPGCGRLSHLKHRPHHLPLRPLSPLCPHSTTCICDPRKAMSRVHTQTSWG